MKTVYILWQDSSYSGRMWHTVAKINLTNSGTYLLNYTIGAKNPRFQPFVKMADKSKKYESNELFNFLKNRIPPESRPEHEALFQWCDLDTQSNYLELLAISGGEKATDNYRVISLPENSNGQYISTFFVSGIRYLSDEQKNKIAQLKDGYQIDYKFEDDNVNDPHAVLLLENSEHTMIGYYPRYLTEDLRNLNKCGVDIKIQIIKVNVDAPEQFRLLCRTIAEWPKNFQSCNNEEFQDF
ncbi:hypothetical protein RFH42_03030 [Acinetobacter rudis]|uniref:HIRAN domain-containing protein n=1 Tax=Acinetobacter rudis TaxID=632955 RepID=UPI00280C403F|nr:HIRAN domain-containing protein [Acinetobacter rudis]MDQ8951927.1 hypothetical protein [Acinetobacter rudis]